jgi:subtilisin family serine protease
MIIIDHLDMPAIDTTRALLSRGIALVVVLALATNLPTSVAETLALKPDGDAWLAKVDPWVLETASRFGSTEFLAYLEQQADLSDAEYLATKQQKAQSAFVRLTAIAGRTQSDLLSMLADRGIDHRSYWIANMVWVRGGIETVAAVAVRPEVRRIVANPRVAIETPLADVRHATVAAASIQPSLSHTGAPTEFWANGFAGQGVVIGGQDTGYDWDHQALRDSYRGWDGDSVDHNHNWHDAIHSGGGSCGADSPEPCDDGSHGTHTMGTMVGDDGGANRIGLAPQARWIGCRNMDQGVGTPATYAECFQWFMAPTDLAGNNPDPSLAPDIINNSWTCPESEGCADPNALRTVVENTRAAGILVVASAGNGGPDCSTIDSPIALYDDVLTVGATNLNDEIAGFSSRGTIIADGSGRRKPDIAAPGVSIRSSVPGGLYSSSNGTSMAGPHVAGMAALVLSAAECKAGRPAKLEKHLLATTLPLPAAELCGEPSQSTVPNNTYGHGVLRAVLPACPRDGRIAGFTTRLDTSRIICRNKRVGKKASVQVGGLGGWNCMARGFEASVGDKILLKLRGSAREGSTLGGKIEGLATIRAVCRNKRSGKKVRIPLAGSKAWNCEQAGLEVEPGDGLQITIIGRARADS